MHAIGIGYRRRRATAQPLPFCYLRRVPTQLPLWSLVALGAYALGNIGWNLMRFNSCPEAAEELQRVSWVGACGIKSNGVSLGRRMDAEEGCVEEKENFSIQIEETRA